MKMFNQIEAEKMPHCQDSGKNAGREFGTPSSWWNIFKNLTPLFSGGVFPFKLPEDQTILKILLDPFSGETNLKNRKVLKLLNFRLKFYGEFSRFKNEFLCRWLFQVSRESPRLLQNCCRNQILGNSGNRLLALNAIQTECRGFAGKGEDIA